MHTMCDYNAKLTNFEFLFYTTSILIRHTLNAMHNTVSVTGAYGKAMHIVSMPDKGITIIPCILFTSILSFYAAGDE